MMKNLCTPVESDDIRTIITTNLDRAAKLNFAQVQQESHLEGLYKSRYFEHFWALSPDFSLTHLIPYQYHQHWPHSNIENCRNIPPI